MGGATTLRWRRVMLVKRNPGHSAQRNHSDQKMMTQRPKMEKAQYGGNGSKQGWTDSKEAEAPRSEPRLGW